MKTQRTTIALLVSIIALGAGLLLVKPLAHRARVEATSVARDATPSAPDARRSVPRPTRPAPAAPVFEIAPGDAAMIDRVYASGRSDFPDTPLGRQLTYHMMIARRYGSEAEQRSDQVVAALRAEAGTAAGLLFDAYAKAEESRYFDRWLMVESLRELRAGSAVDALERIATAPLPTERGNPYEHHGTSTVGEELMIRATAARALGELAIDGNTEARDRLLTIATNPEEPMMVRRAAAWGHAAAYGDEEVGVEALKQALPESEHVAVIHRAGLPFTFNGGVMRPEPEL